MDLTLSDLARNSEQLLNNGLNEPGPLTLILVFSGGLLTSLGPCSLSLLPITVAYLAGFKDDQSPLIRSTSFCTGIILALVILGSLSGLVGKVFGQVPLFFPKIVAILAIFMGLNLLGIFTIQLPEGPDPNIWKNKVPKKLAPISAGLAFGLASSPCTTPVLAVLLAWIAKTANPITGVVLLSCFGLGQVIPLILAGTAAASIPNLLYLRPIGKWIPPISGSILLIVGFLNLLSEWI
ncbi:cytochrome c biogenesis CcdA family protein [Prochlorococcus sp. MIT 1223]|uniref:cytochrome c biogenesis CcdA family protein n=1 Tax=Prochlorococcus sp. MIT 1223 TaxID=3096217 RepID=UPI002A74E0D0|nr:cytochrome c biogenesis CcdA family protein [Prochlorococcus sp. MIT 1223]